MASTVYNAVQEIMYIFIIGQ